MIDTIPSLAPSEAQNAELRDAIASTLTAQLEAPRLVADQIAREVVESDLLNVLRAKLFEQIADSIDEHHLTDELAHEGYDGDGMIAGDVTIPQWLRAEARQLLGDGTPTEESHGDERIPQPKFPHVEVQLVGEDSNAFVIACRVRSALGRGGATAEQEEEFWEEALSGSFDELLATVNRWVTIV